MKTLGVSLQPLLLGKQCLRGGLLLFLRVLPFKKSLARALALLPPVFRGPLSYRFGTALYRQLSWGEGERLTTNLGISASYRISLLASAAEPLHLFGLPKLYAGERGALYLSRALLKDSDCFLDVGAHKGYFSFFVRDGGADKTPIYFLEPDKCLFDELKNNVAANSSMEGTEGWSLAVAETSGEVSFYLDKSDPSCSSLKDLYRSADHVLEKVTVEATSFSDLVRKHDLNRVLVKVDVENAEGEFLRGALAEKRRLEHLIIEILLPATATGFIAEAQAKLEMFAYYINDFSLIYCPDGDFKYQPPEHNWLFTRLDKVALTKALAGTPFSVA